MGWEVERVGIDRGSGVGGERVGIDKVGEEGIEGEWGWGERVGIDKGGGRRGRIGIDRGSGVGGRGWG